MGVRNHHAFLLAALGVNLFWNPMLEKRIPRQAVEDAMTYLFLMSRIIAASVTDRARNTLWKSFQAGKPASLASSFTENVFRFLFGRKPSETDLVELKYLIGIRILKATAAQIVITILASRFICKTNGSAILCPSKV